ncbi:integrase core domain protein [Leptospira alstonii serovar Pingchang str. 80-412]|uniref:Integrase core domain protein n=2 Tax=Leptospira alstonii TaxID=28452 RepID=M6DGK8_9LEPT|nr:integrase core domain protein [Leptospira alstonii serovar Sichuan str. 79601]EQA79439.1 integrase core domain protein [Leptospira alstonii serovar Pingchang str. 80-412]
MHFVTERVNKTLKYEFSLKNSFDNFKETQNALNQAVFLYNNVRLSSAFRPFNY